METILVKDNSRGHSMDIFFILNHDHDNFYKITTITVPQPQCLAIVVLHC